MKKIIILFLSFVFLCGCNSKKTEETTTRTPTSESTAISTIETTK